MGNYVDMAHTTPFELMDLPDEVLLIVMRYLDFDSLLDAIYVSRHFRELAEPFIYESITVLHGEKALNLSHSLAKDIRRPEWVRMLLISTKFGQEHALMKLPPFICNMDNLQDLRLETPDCNAKRPEDREFWIELQDYYEKIFYQSSVLVPDRRNRLLPNLKSCVLHFVDTHTELYALSRYSSIFLHPTLESLTISCMSTDRPEALFKNIPDIDRFKRTTALEYLHLEECDFYPTSLELLLSFPRALKSLKISEGIRYDGIFRAGSSRVHGNVRPQAFAQALINTCRDSLESLSLALGHVRSHGFEIGHTDQHLKLQDLDNLKHLEVNNRTLNLIRSRPECDHNTWKRLPPSLETFKIFAVPLLPPQHDARQPYIPLHPCIIREKKLHGLPKLKKIIYSYEHYESTDDEEMNFNDLLMNLVYHEANGNPPVADNNTNQTPNQHANPILNLLQHAVGAVHPPQPAPAPANTTFVTANPNADLDQPPQNIQPPRFRWRTGPTFSARRHHFRPELSRSDTAKLGLLTTINETVLSHFAYSNTLLEIDLVTLPRSFIPPYLFPEDKPRIHEAWFTSTRPMTPDYFVECVQRKRNVANMHFTRSRHGDIGEDGVEMYDSERERSRSRFIRRLREHEADHASASADSDTDTDIEDAGGEVAAATDSDDPDHLLVAQDDDEDDMEVEDMLEMLVAEAHAGFEVDNEADMHGRPRSSSSSSSSSSSESSGGSVYVDADMEVDMEMEDEDQVDSEEEDDDSNEVDHQVNGLRPRTTTTTRIGSSRTRRTPPPSSRPARSR